MATPPNYKIRRVAVEAKLACLTSLGTARRPAEALASKAGPPRSPRAKRRYSPSAETRRPSPSSTRYAPMVPVPSPRRSSQSQERRSASPLAMGVRRSRFRSPVSSNGRIARFQARTSGHSSHQCAISNCSRESAGIRAFPIPWTSAASLISKIFPTK